MRKGITSLLAATFLLSACSNAAPTVPAMTLEPVSSGTPEPTSSPTLEPTPTPTLEPTLTPTLESQNSPTPEPVYEYDTETVSFITEDDLKLSGTYFGAESDVAVLFVHMGGGAGQNDWVPFANKVAQRGFSALTFDMRCFGESDCRGGSDPARVVLARDVQAAIKFLRDKGFKRIVCMGASMGGRGCIAAAFNEELAGMVILSSNEDPDLKVLENMLNPGMPKLFVVSERDVTTAGINVTAEMTSLYERSPEPKDFQLLPGTLHGTDLFKTENEGALSRLLFDFLYTIRDVVSFE